MTENRMDLITRAYEGAKNRIEEGGEEYPHYVLFNEADEECVVVCPWGNDQEKEMGINMTRLIALKHRTTSLVFISEVWVSTQERGEKYIQPRNHPNRRESLLMMSVSHDGSASFQADITRQDGVKVGPLCPAPHLIEDNLARVVLPPKKVVDSLTDEQLATLEEVMRSMPGIELMKFGGEKDTHH